MATKKASPAQLAARKKFAEMARTGAFKKRKSNPKTSNTALANWLDQIASGDTFSETKLKEALKHPAVTAEDKIVIKAALIGKPYSHTDLYDAAIHIRQYGKRAANPRKKTVSQKISQLTHEGYPQKQAVAVALSEQRAGKVKRNPMKHIAGEHDFNLGNNYYARITMTGNNEYYAVIFKRYVESNGFVSEDIVPDYKPRYFVSAKSAVNSFMKYATKNLKPNPTRQRATRRTAVMQNPRAKKLQKFYQVSIMQDGLHTKWMPIANFYTFAEAENYSHYLSKQHKNWSIRVHDKRAM